MPTTKSKTLRTLATIATAGATLFVLLIVHGLDDWLGILAYPLRYVAIASGLAGLVALPWFLHNNRSGSLAGGLALLTLLTPYVTPAPSSRLLRSAMISVPFGATEVQVRASVAEAYARSDYELPLIQSEENKIHVSLSNQRPGDCTSVSFHTEAGRVVHKSFSCD